MTWFTEANTQQDIIDRAPTLAPAFQDFYDSFWQLSSIPPMVLELCRLRVAQLHQSDYQWQHQQRRFDSTILHQPTHNKKLEANTYQVDPKEKRRKK